LLAAKELYCRLSASRSRSASTFDVYDSLDRPKRLPAVLRVTSGVNLRQAMHDSWRDYLGTHPANLKRHRAIGANGVWYEVSENDLEPIDRHCTKQCVALVDEVQNRPNNKGNEKRTARHAVGERATTCKPQCSHHLPNLLVSGRPDNPRQFRKRFDLVVGLTRQPFFALSVPIAPDDLHSKR